MTAKKSQLSTRQLIIGGLIIFAAVAGGILIGGLSRDVIADRNEPEIAPDIFTGLTLQPQTQFPNYYLYDADKYLYDSKALLSPNGTVVLFMEHGCTPCHGMVKQLQSLINTGILHSEQVVGISFSEASTLNEMVEAYDLTFKVYADENFAFYDSCGVDAFPLVLMVDSDGTILYSDYDSRNKLDEDLLDQFIL